MSVSIYLCTAIVYSNTGPQAGNEAVTTIRFEFEFD